MSGFMCPQPPPLIGADMRNFPYISPIGELIRLARLNHLRASSLPIVLGIEPAIQKAFMNGRYLPWTELDDWQKSRHDDAIPWAQYVYFQGPRCRDIARRLRLCLACARYGYHTMLFQLPWMTHCPWHRTALRNACECGRTWLPAMADRKHHPLLVCVCGRDPYHRMQALVHQRRFPSADVRSRIDILLAVSARRHEGCHIVAPADVSAGEALTEVLRSGQFVMSIPRPAGSPIDPEWSDRELMGHQLASDLSCIHVTDSIVQRLAKTALEWRCRLTSDSTIDIRVAEDGIFVQGVPILTHWRDEPMARLERWCLSDEWPQFIPMLCSQFHPADGRLVLEAIETLASLDATCRFEDLLANLIGSANGHQKHSRRRRLCAVVHFTHVVVGSVVVN